MAIGMIFSDPHIAHKSHTDTIRMHALQNICSKTQVFGVSQTTECDSPTGISGDIRHIRCWKIIDKRAPVVGILDYFWLPSEYLSGNNNVGLGYGGDWFTKQLQWFFKYGSVFFLPNDKAGLFLQMSRSAHDNHLTIKPLTWSQRLRHPLFRATENVACHPAWQTSIQSIMVHKTNASALEWLNKTEPFLVVYKAERFRWLSDALQFVDDTCGMVSPFDSRLIVHSTFRHPPAPGRREVMTIR